MVTFIKPGEEMGKSVSYKHTLRKARGFKYGLKVEDLIIVNSYRIEIQFEMDFVQSGSFYN